MRHRWQTILVIRMVLGLVATAEAQEAASLKLPETAEEHAAAAKQYEQKADGYRQEAATHEAMLEAAYRAEVHSKAPIRRKWEQMRTHCTPIIQDAKRLTEDMEVFAAFHKGQAEELKAQERREASRESSDGR